MVPRLRHRNIWIAIVTLYLVSVVAVGFGHRPPEVARQGTFDIAAAPLPDGTRPVLCGSLATQTPSDSREDGDHEHRCEACLASVGLALAAPAATPLDVEFGFLRQRRPPAAQAPAPAPHYATSARSPPRSLPAA